MKALAVPTPATVSATSSKRQRSCVVEELLPRWVRRFRHGGQKLLRRPANVRVGEDVLVGDLVGVVAYPTGDKELSDGHCVGDLRQLDLGGCRCVEIDCEGNTGHCAAAAEVEGDCRSRGGDEAEAQAFRTTARTRVRMAFLVVRVARRKHPFVGRIDTLAALTGPCGACSGRSARNRPGSRSR